MTYSKYSPYKYSCHLIEKLFLQRNVNNDFCWLLTLSCEGRLASKNERGLLLIAGQLLWPTDQQDHTPYLLPLPFHVLHHSLQNWDRRLSYSKDRTGCHCTELCNPPWFRCLTSCSSASWWFHSSQALLSAAAATRVLPEGAVSPLGEKGLYLVWAGMLMVEEAAHWWGVNSVLALHLGCVQPVLAQEKLYKSKKF